MSMFLLQRRILLVGLIVVASGEFARGGNYSDPSGFSFTHPDDWVAIKGNTLGNVDQDLPEETKGWIAKNKVDLSKIAMVLLRKGEDEFLENLNVVVENQELPLDSNSVKQLTEAITQQYRQMGATPVGFQARVEQVGGRDALVASYQIQVPGMPAAMRQKQVMFPGGGKTYIVTCTAMGDTYEKHRSTFDNVLSSFQAPTPIKKGFSLDGMLTMGLVGAIVGGVVAALIALARKRSN
jgi:hypothetical protein